MNDISEVQRRIVAALDRAGQALDQLGARESDGGGDSAQLAAELEAERVANQQLEERVRAIKEKQETMVAALQDEVATLRAALSETDAGLQRLKSVNAELRSTNAALREANARGLSDAGLVNDGLAAEVEALRVLEAGNRAEIDRALGLLEPMLKEAANA